MNSEHSVDAQTASTQVVNTLPIVLDMVNTLPIVLDNGSVVPTITLPPPPPSTPNLADPTNILYNKMILNTSLLTLINSLKNKGFTGSDIPSLMLCVLSIYNNYTTNTKSHTLSVDDIQSLLESVYNYLVDRYDLVESSQRLSMFELFDTTLKLTLSMPNVKKDVSRCFRFLKC